MLYWIEILLHFFRANKGERLGTKKVTAMDEHRQKRNLIPLKKALAKGGFGKTKAYELIDQEKIIAYRMGGDLPLNFHPVAVRVSGFCTPSGAGGATGDRRSWSGLRSRSPVAVNVAA